jgi:hypothetical protein
MAVKQPQETPRNKEKMSKLSKLKSAFSSLLIPFLRTYDWKNQIY